MFALLVLLSVFLYNKRYENLKGEFLMSNRAIEEKIKTLSADYIYRQAVGSLLLLLMSAMEDAEKGVTALPYEIPADVQEIKEEIKAYLLRLEELLGSDTTSRMAALESCMDLKKRLLSIYETIYSYFSQWNVISTFIGDQVALRRYQAEGVSEKQVEWSLFFADCHAFLEDAETVLEQKTYMGQLLKCIPLYMTRDKYYDMIFASLEAAFAEESKELIAASLKAFECFCSPRENPLYGKYFPELAQWIGQKQMLLPNQLSHEALIGCYEEMEEVFEALEEIEEYFSCILHDINSLILLFYLTYSFTDLTEGSAAYADLYHIVCDFISDKLTITEKAAYLDTLNEQLEEAVEPIIDQANRIGREEHELLQKAGSFANFSEDTKSVLMSEAFIRECFFGDLQDELFYFDIPEDLPAATAAERDTLFRTFIEKTRSHFDTLPVQTRKLAMQNLIGALPPIYSVHEAMDRIMEAIDQAASEEQRILIVDKVGMVFNENGWQSFAEGPEDACACGHDHHDCGHGHHHHH